MTTVKHLHANFDSVIGKKALWFIHGEDEIGTASMSEPTSGKTAAWGMSDPHHFVQFEDQHPGEAQWGLGSGEVVGNPNVMDVSQLHGMVVGAGWPGGPLYYRAVDEMRGRYLSVSLTLSEPHNGIPRVLSMEPSVCSVWTAKSRSIPLLSDGIVGILSGSSLGIISCFSLGTEGLRERRLTRGELTARWAVSPGVPIIGLAVDDNFSVKRAAQNRIWAVALNALGEVYYLSKIPRRPHTERASRVDQDLVERMAWITGRSVHWNLVEPSRREARPDPYQSSEVDGSYSPRSSWRGMCLSASQLEAETREIELFMGHKPKYFRHVCLGWDMRRRLEVDFAGDDGKYAGEAVLVFECGLEEGHTTQVKRYTRCRVSEDESTPPSRKRPFHTAAAQAGTPSSLFGDIQASVEPSTESNISNRSSRGHSETSSQASHDEHVIEEWRCSMLSFCGQRVGQITTTTMDQSTYAQITVSEDPAIAMQHTPGTRFPSGTSIESDTYGSVMKEIPGQRARLVALGTSTGDILIWDARAAVPEATNIVNNIEPVRIIHTDSPQISCLGLTALYLISGGNDGLVQMWDPLASSNLPIRTLNSRFSSRARRRLAQADASVDGIGINMYAAGAIRLDPDPTRLRGMVSLGSHLRYWSYSTSSTDRYKGSKRRLRKSGRLSNGAQNPDYGVSTKSGNLRDYIADEWTELDRARTAKQRETKRLAGRFGVDLLGPDASEEELLAYAAMLSEESLAEESRRRLDDSSSPTSSVDSADLSSVSSSNPVTPTASGPLRASKSPQLKSDAELEADIARAIRLSLDGESHETRDSVDGLPFESGSQLPTRSTSDGRNATLLQQGGSIPWNASSEVGKCEPSSSRVQETDSDLELAIQISLAEQQSAEYLTRGGLSEQEDFPALISGRDQSNGNGNSNGKEKQKGKEKAKEA
jgi:hypothetical protein